MSLGEGKWMTGYLLLDRERYFRKNSLTSLYFLGINDQDRTVLPDKVPCLWATEVLLGT